MAKVPDGFHERVNAHSLRVVARDIEAGLTPPPQVSVLLVRCADMIDELKSQISPGYRPSTTLDVDCPLCEGNVLPLTLLQCHVNDGKGKCHHGDLVKGERCGHCRDWVSP
jgi:hypothetical protein